MAAYAITIFLGAFLLFQIQPLVGKFILPWFGGGSSVWTTCMLFFQWLLLGGYLYSHLTSTRMRPKAQATFHLFVLGVAVCFLPIIPDEIWKPSPGDQPTLRILLLLTACVGMPYFVLSTTGPLIQRWFSLANPGANPYRLYALSNVGSLLALITYPFVFEPTLSRVAQANWWSAGMITFVICCGFCAWRIRQLAPESSQPKEAKLDASAPAAQPEEPVTTTQRILWLALPAAASMLLLASTNKMCLDVASFPFLWILPLCLYLLTFIISFDHPRWYNRPVWCGILLISLGLVCWIMERDYDDTIVLQIFAFSLVLFVGCMVCHGELFRLKPPPRKLTSYFLMISAGGALGGLFVAVGAPLLFVGYYEYHASLLLVVLLTLAVLWVDKKCVLYRGQPHMAWFVLFLIPLILGYVLVREIAYSRRNAVDLSRNFYGALTVFEFDQDDPEKHHYLLMHGGITHGLQAIDSPDTHQPTSYYAKTSGVGMALTAFPREKNRRIGVIGLGTGTMAAHAKAGDVMRIYEIDPAVRDLANNRFTYLNHARNTGADIEVVMGDARLSMENEEPQEYDILVIDAFSSDAIPVHLVTREAFEVYQKHLKFDGVIAAHISNRHLELTPVVLSLAREFNFEARLVANLTDDEPWWFYYSDWMLITKNKAFLNHQVIWDESYEPEDPPENFRLWTDDYSSLFSVMDWSLIEKDDDEEVKIPETDELLDELEKAVKPSK